MVVVLGWEDGGGIGGEASTAAWLGSGDDGDGTVSNENEAPS